MEITGEVVKSKAALSFAILRFRTPVSFILAICDNWRKMMRGERRHLVSGFTFNPESSSTFAASQQRSFLEVGA